ncbi:MAG: hypothetical protein FD153_1587 [Rhodospirillaceae bacterium]|nr:MAG: hypothetical protein FD153_1587 [Rhodospirillaceae bacterium]
MIERGNTNPRHHSLPVAGISQREAGVLVSPSGAIRGSGLFQRFLLAEGSFFQMVPHQNLGNLDGIEGRPLAQVVGHTPEGKAIGDRTIRAQARDIDRILADGFNRRDVGHTRHGR